MPKLTKKYVEALKPKERDYVVRDSTLTNFCVRVLPSGVKTYMIQYRQNGRQRKYNIGKHGAVTLDQARTIAQKLLARVADGADPAEERAVYLKAPDVRTLGERFMTEYVSQRCKPRTASEYQRALDLFIYPAFGSRKIVDITRADIAELHHKHRHIPYQANRTLGVLSKMFNLAELWGLRDDGSNPTRHIQKYSERKRERFLSGGELGRLFRTLDECEADGSESKAACNAFRLLCLTGCRLSEIQTLKWSYVQPPYLVLPDSKTGPRRIPISREAQTLLEGMKPVNGDSSVNGNPYVIAGTVNGQHLTDLQRPWRRIRKRARLEDVRIHDLRHTYASNAVMAGLSLEEVGKLLGHTQIQTTQRYAHLADDHMHAVAAQVSERISASLSKEPVENKLNTGEVVDLATYRAPAGGRN
jgi:integrase